MLPGVGDFRKAYYLKLWDLDEKNSYREPHRFIEQLAPEHYHAPEFVKLNNWNWKKKYDWQEQRKRKKTEKEKEE